MDNYNNGQNQYNQNGYESIGETQVLNVQNTYEQSTYDQNTYNQNAYNQNVYEQNEYNQSGYNQSGYTQNEYMQNSYAQEQYVQNTYEQNQYVQQPQYSQQPQQQQQQYLQQQYQQQQYPQQTQQYQQPQQNMYNGVGAYVQQQMPTYQLPAYQAPSKKPIKYYKSNRKKRILIWGIILLVIGIAATIFLLNYFSKSFDVNDYNKVNKAFKKVYGEELEKYDMDELNEDDENTYNVVDAAQAYGNVDDEVFASATWYKVKDEKSAIEYMKYIGSIYKEYYEEDKDEYTLSGWEANEDIIESYYSYADKAFDKTRVFIVRDKNCILIFETTGPSGNVDKAFEDFKKEIR